MLGHHEKRRHQVRSLMKGYSGVRRQNGPLSGAYALRRRGVSYDGANRETLPNMPKHNRRQRTADPQDHWLIESTGQVVFINSPQGTQSSRWRRPIAATKHAKKAVADSLRDEVNAAGVRVTSVFLGRTATEMQRAIFALEGRPY